MDGKAVIFDMDGVLVNSYRAHWRSWRAMAEMHGLAITERQFAQTFGRTTRDIIHCLWGSGVRDADIPVWDAQKEAAFRKELEADFPEMPGAGDLILALHQAGFAMAIGSSGPPENIATVLKCLRNSRYITAHVNGMEVKNGKPQPDVFLLAAGKLGVEAGNCAVIEDAPAGIEAALRAGMAAIALVGTAGREQLAPAHLIVDSLTELSARAVEQIIANHNRKPMQ